MSRYVITFVWEETDELDYELLMSELIGLGAEDIRDELEPQNTEGAVEGPPRRKKPKA